MSAINKIMAALTLLTVAGCNTVPDGQAPKCEIVRIPIRETELEPAAAVNYFATSLAAFFLDKNSKSVPILILSDLDGKVAVNDMYAQLKLFAPVKSVQQNYEYVLESRYQTLPDGRTVWQLILKSGDEVVWSDNVGIGSSAQAADYGE